VSRDRLGIEDRVKNNKPQKVFFVFSLVAPEPAPDDASPV
jgi:hypothetical protein